MNPDSFNCDDLSPDVQHFIHQKCTSLWILEESVTDFVEVIYIVKGYAEFTVDFAIYPASAGDLICIPKNCRRSAFCSENDLMECYCVKGNMRDLMGQEVTLPFPVISHIGLQPDLLTLFHDINTEWLLRDQGYGLKVRALYMIILQRLLRLIAVKDHSKVMDKRIKRVLRHITDHYSEPLTVQSMAKTVGLSSMYFGNFFREQTGQSFHQYLTSIRLYHAENMLRSGEYNVNEVAASCGFSDIFYFSKVFKKSRGISPSQIIRSPEIYLSDITNPGDST